MVFMVINLHCSELLFPFISFAINQSTSETALFIESATDLPPQAPGSAFAALQDRGWAAGLSAGERVEQNDVAAFSVRVDLTEEGERHWQEVGKIVFDHIRLLGQHSGSSGEASNNEVELARLWDEMAAMSKVNFENSEAGAAQSTALSLSKRLHLFGGEHCVSAGSLFADKNNGGAPLAVEKCDMCSRAHAMHYPFIVTKPLKPTVAACLGDTMNQKWVSVNDIRYVLLHRTISESRLLFW